GLQPAPVGSVSADQHVPDALSSAGSDVARRRGHRGGGERAGVDVRNRSPRGHLRASSGLADSRTAERRAEAASRGGWKRRRERLRSGRGRRSATRGGIGARRHGARSFEQACLSGFSGTGPQAAGADTGLLLSGGGAAAADRAVTLRACLVPDPPEPGSHLLIYLEVLNTTSPNTEASHGQAM